MPVGATLSKDESSRGGDESHGSDGPKRKQQGEASSSLSPETDYKLVNLAYWHSRRRGIGKL
jgi:hypothetical protein